ncbi:MAG TPA: glycosyltransferase family 2 protein [Blastocatellia bacterium]|nr:glycosyltransferase family 2 protein [Blastocatellia bacterium]
MMIDRKRVFVIIPAYNEGQVIHGVVKPLIEVGYSIVVIDDASTDGSQITLSALPIHYLRHAVNLGQGAALQTGMTYAVQQGAEYIIHFDADGQHHHEDIPSLLEPLVSGEADIVFGSRFLRAADENSVPRIKRLALRAGVVADRLIAGIRLTDAHNGFRALNRQAASRICLRENRYAHASEILVQVRRLRLRYAERPTRIEYTEYSKSKGQSLWNAFNILFDALIRRLIG